jgi:hypothetical protein
VTTDDEWDKAQARLEGRCELCGAILPEHDLTCKRHVRHRAIEALRKARYNMQMVQSIVEYGADKEPELREELIREIKKKRDV